MELTTQQKKKLLSLVHNSITSGFHPITVDPQIDKDDAILNAKLGAFVTLKIENKLRGCIGYIYSDQELHKTINEVAYKASFEDPRFAPLTEIEYPKTSIEISVLSELFNLNNYDEIVLGKHGLILEDLGKKSLFLPQVPIEHKMNRDEYLSALCKKAGFNSDYWREKELKLKAFTAFVFS